MDKQEERIRKEFHEKHPEIKGYGAGELPEILELGRICKKKYAAILEKYKDG